ncbi:MAG TPA: DUF1570 domain-containing protein [Phycisphaerae bacterium]|nr:DUF1570 domain-containing protein [Phycisphaerae bacterium]HPS52804.1 DUF1570 domain-containing protein [Phycisphaerae bacterium]
MRFLKAVILLVVLFDAAVAENFTEPTRKTLPVKFRPFKTTHYVIYTDWDICDSMIARIRLECNYRSFRRLAVKLYRPMPGRCNVYLFADVNDYYAAGGFPNTRGCYIWTRMGKRNPKVWLMAWLNGSVFEVMQHEGFHQFAMNAFPQIPLWLNEGLAEYFNYAKWTGDELLEGFVSANQLAIVRNALLKNAFAPMKKFMTISDEEWKNGLRSEANLNYCQAWSIVHFFMHADDGKYRENFEKFLCQLARGTKADEAWKSCFAENVETIEAEYKNWWLTKAEETAELDSIACARIFISFIGRNFTKGYQPINFETFVKDANDGRLKLAVSQDKENYLPDSLLNWALDNYSKAGEYFIGCDADGQPFVRLKLPESGTYIYTFKPRSVGVNVIEKHIPRVKTAPAAP